MKIEVICDRFNPYLDRREIELRIYHEGSSIPKKSDVFNAAVRLFSLNPENTVVIRVEGLRGKAESRALIYYYPNGIVWSTIEPPKRKALMKEKGLIKESKSSSS
ncbi:MAG: hypothetical protein QXH96_00345 [Candidatus Geothermarchaeota archaeon]